MGITSQKSIPTKTFFWPRLALAWGLGNIAAYFLTSFFSNFYPFLYQFIFLSIFFQLLGLMGMIFLFRMRNTREENRTDRLSFLPLAIAFFLSIAALWMVWQFPGLFHRQILFMDAARLPFFVLLSAISLIISTVLLKRLNQAGFTERLERARFFHSVQDSWPGVLLAGLFFFTYFVFAQSINFPQYRTLDLYFDTDISVWLARLTATKGEEISMVRAVHPAILIFFRPVVAFFSFFFAGDRLQAVFLMNALAGAFCVLLAWLIIKSTSGNTTYSLVMASILGASSSHLLLSSMFETYIYSALALLFFIFLLQTEKTSLKFTVPAGILVFGITITNIIQTCILYFFQHPRLKTIIKYVLIVVAIVLFLNVLQVWLYPNSQSLLMPTNLLYEQRYVANPLEWSWRTAGRFSLTIRAILLYGIVAPTPFILTKEFGMDVPNFRTFQILLGEFHVAPYRDFADVTVKVWSLILGIAVILFILSFFRSPKRTLFPLSLLLCIGFSFVLHLVYGDDPLLYSPNWVYALVLFVALAFQKWADKWWLQLGMLVFLVMLLYTNLGLIHQILDVSAPFYSTGN